MKYIKQYKDIIPTPMEITKDEARSTLEGYWEEDVLEDIFTNGKMFRLYTPYAYVWTVNDDGMIPMAGYYGIC